MKKLFISLLAASTAIVAYSAAYDITPPRYDFSQYPVGSLAGKFTGKNRIDTITVNRFTGASAYASLQPFDAQGGVINLVSGQFASEELKKGVANGLSIVNLGGEAGNVLCWKGRNSQYYPEFTAATSGITGALTFAFYPRIGDFVPGESTTWETYSHPTARMRAQQSGYSGDIGHDLNDPYRVRAIVKFEVVFRFMDNKAETGVTPTQTAKIESAHANGVVGRSISQLTSRHFTTIVEDPETLEPVAVYDNQKWYKATMYHYSNEKGAVPICFYLTFENKNDEGFLLNEKIIFIKSVKMTTGYDLGESGFFSSLSAMGWNSTNTNGPALIPNDIDFVQMTGTNVVNAKLEKLDFTVRNGVLTVNNVENTDAINVFTISGQLLKTQDVVGNSTSISLERGLYIVKAGTRAAKVVVN